MAEVALELERHKPRLIRQELVELSRRLAESPAGLALRDRALDIFGATPVPDRVRHLWRYTDPVDLYPPAWLTPSAGAASASKPTFTLLQA